MEESKQHIMQIKEYIDNLVKNFKEDLQTLKDDFIDKQDNALTKRFSIHLPLPKEVYVVEKLVCDEDSYTVIFEVNCGLRKYTTELYLGQKPSPERIVEERKKCVLNAVQQCLEGEDGEVHQLSESGNLVAVMKF